MLYSRHLAYKNQPSTLNIFSISEGKFSTFSITLWLSTDSVWNLQFVCQESVPFVAGLTGFTMKYQIHCLSGVTSIMTVRRIRGWLYSQPFCYSSPSPGTLIVYSILTEMNMQKSITVQRTTKLCATASDRGQKLNAQSILQKRHITEHQYMINYCYRSECVKLKWWQSPRILNGSGTSIKTNIIFF